jgi:hypothetical protein
MTDCHIKPSFKLTIPNDKKTIENAARNPPARAPETEIYSHGILLHIRLI